MNNCLETGTIQAFLDGELAAGQVLSVTNHIADCDACALALAEAEEETAFVFAALDREFDTLVPTQRLWAKINDSIVEEKKGASIWQKLRQYAAVSLANPSFAVAASILIVFGIFAALLMFRPDSATQTIAEIKVPTQEILPIKTVETVEKTTTENPILPIVADKNENTPRVVNANYRQNTPRTNVIQADYNRPNKIKINDSGLKTADSGLKTESAYLPGEESYVRTIASLTQTVDGSKNEALKPSAQIAFARDLAVVDDAIGKMKTEIKKNPKNEAAKQVLYSSYQNKIDLLSSVADKNELMASLK